MTTALQFSKFHSQLYWRHSPSLVSTKAETDGQAVTQLMEHLRAQWVEAAEAHPSKTALLE